MAPQPRSPIADSQLVRMRYCATGIELNPGAGTADTLTFRANDLYDPESTGVGHQPYGYDQWMQFYNHFTVVGSKIKVTFVPEVATANGNNICTIHVADDTSVTTNLTLLMERTGTVWGLAANMYGRPCTLTKKFSTKKFFNKSNVRDCEELKGSITAGPSDQAHYHVSCFNPDGTTDNNPVPIAVQIDYIVLLSERKDLTQS